jgi:hypothetical protein
MNLGTRPAIVKISCAVLAALTAYLLQGALAPAQRFESVHPGVYLYAGFVALNFLFVWLIWVKRGWSRYAVVLWWVIPTILGAIAEAPIFEVSVWWLLFERLFLSWLSLGFLFACFALFLPPSNNWFSRHGYTAT